MCRERLIVEERELTTEDGGEGRQGEEGGGAPCPSSQATPKLRVVSGGRETEPPQKCEGEKHKREEEGVHILHV